MTHLFQPLDLTVNDHCNSYMKGKFAEWYHKQVEDTLAHGKKIEDIEIKFCLMVIKPIHAKWLMEFHNHITSEDGSKVIINGWKRSGIYEAVKGGSPLLPSIDPFDKLIPLADDNGKSNYVDVTLNDCESLTEKFVNYRFDDEESEWENDNEIEFERSASDAFIIDDE